MIDPLIFVHINIEKSKKSAKKEPRKPLNYKVFDDSQNTRIGEGITYGIK